MHSVNGAHIPVNKPNFATNKRAVCGEGAPVQFAVGGRSTDRGIPDTKGVHDRPRPRHREIAPVDINKHMSRPNLDV